jgi:hypothetical protein
MTRKPVSDKNDTGFFVMYTLCFSLKLLIYVTLTSLKVIEKNRKTNEYGTESIFIVLIVSILSEI